MTPMKVFTCKFSGVYPVGACAVVVAPSRAMAAALMRTELKRRGLGDKNKAPLKLDELDANTAGAHVVLDGDY